jgi:predicted kinase
VRLTFSSDAVVVVAGLPGAGKTTLIRRAVDRSIARVVDTDDRRRRRPQPFLYAGHYARILAAVAGRRPVVIHSRGTHAGLRRAIAVVAAVRGRPAHLILLDADPADADAGQRARGRIIARAEMARHAARWRTLMARRPIGEGWSSLVVLDRGQAARTLAIDFPEPAAAPERRVAAATM